MILVDSNVWIFGAKEDVPEHKLALRRLSELLPRNEVAINPIIVSEVFHKIFVMHGSAEAKRKTDAILQHPLINWLTFTKTTTTKAVALAGATGLRINDAMIAQQAIDMNLSVLTDDAKDFGKVKKLRVISLR